MTFKELQTKLTDAMKEKNRVKKTVIADMIACAILGCISFECGGNPGDYKKYDLKLDADNGDIDTIRTGGFGSTGTK